MFPNCSFKTWIQKMLLEIDTPLNYSCFGRKLFMRSCWMLQTTGFHICKQKTIDNFTWNLSLKFIEVHIFCYLIPVIGKIKISWFYAYVELIEIKSKTVNIIHFPYLDWSIPKCPNPWCTLFIEESKEFRMQIGTRLWYE